MTHHSDDWSAWQQVLCSIYFFFDGVADLFADVVRGETKFFSDNVDGFGVKTLVDTYHHADRHTGADDFVDRNIHHGSQFADGYKLGQFQHLAFCTFLHFLFSHTVADSITFLFAILHALLFLLRGETSQSLLYLLGHFLIAEFLYIDRLILLVFLLLSLWLLLSILLLLLLLLIAARSLLLTLVLVRFGLLSRNLLAGSFHVDALFANAVTLLLGIASLGSLALLSLLLLTLFVAFLLALTGTLAVRACLGVDAVQVDKTNLLKLHTGLLWCSQTIHTVFVHFQSVGW